jgi:hypothetical protein
MTNLVNAIIEWKSTKETEEVTFGIGDFESKLDKRVFYWVEDDLDLHSLTEKLSTEDFFIKNFIQ